jgi:pimeloyl-ACP methyl ester carboxylesterase
MPVLARAGYHVVAPWLRGFAPSAIPPDGQYTAAVRAADVNALHEAFGGDERAALVGHDFGASAAYGAAEAEPRRWRRLVTLAVPPPALMATKRTLYDQLRRAWYMYFFQRPNAESVVAADGYAFVERLWRDWSPSYEPGADLPRAKDALAGEHLGAVLGYYRAMFDPAPAPLPIAQPTLYLHGRDDGCIGVEIVENVEAFLPANGSRAERIAGAGHFLHLEAPVLVNAAIAGFLS